MTLSWGVRVKQWLFDLHPWDLLCVSKLEDEFVDHTINTDGSADQL